MKTEQSCLTPAVRRALARLRVAQRFYRPGLDSASVVEIPKIDLAEAFLQALRDTRPTPVKVDRMRVPRRKASA